MRPRFDIGDHFDALRYHRRIWKGADCARDRFVWDGRWLSIGTTVRRPEVKRACLSCAVAAFLSGFPTTPHPWHVYAGEVRIIELPTTKDYLINPNTILIQNAADQEIVFHLTPDAEKSKLLRLGSNETRLFSDGVSTTYVIDVPTEGSGSVRYALQGSRRYQIDWNGERWDVRELTTK
jgi:hypothetical protein